MYAGTPDLVCLVGKETHLIDWKASVSPVCKLQLAAYAMALEMKGIHIDKAYPVIIKADGRYAVAGRDYVMDRRAITQSGRYWQNVVSVFRWKEMNGMIKESE
jgi:CRISPR/Cas system-associated exonuclease Cas4 (RecB family)